MGIYNQCTYTVYSALCIRGHLFSLKDFVRPRFVPDVDNHIKIEKY